MSKPLVLSDRDKIIIQADIMRLSRKETIQFMIDSGHSTGASNTSITKIKRRLREHTLKRIHDIANSGFEIQHVRRVDTTETVERLLWKEYHDEQHPFKRAQILMMILKAQSYVSAYYEATRDVVEKSDYFRRTYSNISRDTREEQDKGGTG